MYPSEKNEKLGVTLIELIMVIMILGIIGTAGGSFFGPVMNLMFFIPSQVRTESIGNLTEDLVIEGDSRARGVRVLHAITSASDTSLAYTDYSSTNVTLSWDSSTKKLSRSIPATTEVVPIEYPGNDVKLDGQTSGVIFKYYDVNGTQLSSPVSNPATIVRVKLDWVFYTGTGSGNVRKYSETKYTLDSGSIIKQF